MKLLIPFWDLNLVDRYYPQLYHIAKHVDELHLVYHTGEPTEIIQNTFHLEKFSLPAAFHRWASWYMATPQIKDIAQKVRPDVIYTFNGLWFQYHGLTMSEATGAPLVIRLQGDTRAAPGLLGYGKTKNLLYQTILERAYRRAALFIPVAEKLRPIAMSYGVSPTKIANAVPNGIDLDKFQYRPMPPMYHALYVGRVSPEKGSDFLIKLMHHTPEIKYGVVGPVQCDWDPPGNCETIGQVPYSEIQDIYHNANIVLLPSRTEGIPNTLLEAYASGRPVIGTPDAIPQEIKVYGIRVRLDVETWAELLRRIKWFNLDEMGRHAREYVKQFSWENYGRRMAALIQSTLEGETPELEVEPWAPSIKQV